MSHQTQKEADLFWEKVGRQPLYSFHELVRGKLEDFHQITAAEVRSQSLPAFSMSAHQGHPLLIDLLQVALIARLPDGRSESVLVLLNATNKAFVAEPVRWTYRTPDGEVHTGELQQAFAFPFGPNRENHEGRRNFVRACRVLTMIERDTENPLAPIASNHLRAAITALIERQPPLARVKL